MEVRGKCMRDERTHCFQQQEKGKHTEGKGRESSVRQVLEEKRGGRELLPGEGGGKECGSGPPRKKKEIG